MKNSLANTRWSWVQPLVVALIISLAAVALGLAIWARNSASFPTGQKLYSASGPISSSPSGHVFTGNTPQTMTLPHNLLEYIGGTYNIDCASPLAHVVRITPGVMGTSFDGTATMATCNAGQPDAGFTFRVITPARIRVISSNEVVFS
jgi:hypothetical protein